MNKTLLASAFRDCFQKEARDFFFCPGRVNLIGEHVDYNGGWVLPCAIEQGIFLAITKNTDKRIRFHCLDFSETAELHLQTSYSKSGKAWYNYPLGVIHGILQQEHPLSGIDMLFAGDLPIGSGLSSSAAVEVVTGFALREIFGLAISLQELAILVKRSENNFLSVNCGIMDPFTVTMGKEGQAIMLNCDSLEFEYIPFKINPFELVIINTNKPRILAESKYNDRFSECAEVLTMLKEELQIENLCDLDPGVFSEYEHLLTDPVLKKRARHVIFENGRVKDAAIALQTGDIETFGKLLYASHASLRDDYEVSCAELDTIVDFSRSIIECAGARMTGAGFGGCAIALVRSSAINEYASGLTKYYSNTFGFAPSIFRTGAADSVKRI